MEKEVLFGMDVAGQAEVATDVWGEHAAGYRMFEGEGICEDMLQGSGY